MFSSCLSMDGSKINGSHLPMMCYSSFFQDSEGSRLNTASSEALEPMEKDSVLERSSSIFVSMSNTPVPRTPKTAESLRPSE